MSGYGIFVLPGIYSGRSVCLHRWESRNRAREAQQDIKDSSTAAAAGAGVGEGEGQETFVV